MANPFEVKGSKWGNVTITMPYEAYQLLKDALLDGGADTIAEDLESAEEIDFSA